MEIYKLDHPAWYALQETHKEFVEDYKGMKYYQADYCPFGAWMDVDTCWYLCLCSGL